MSPCTSSRNFPDGQIADWEQGSQFFVAYSGVEHSSDFEDLAPREFGRRVLITLSHFGVLSRPVSFAARPRLGLGAGAALCPARSSPLQVSITKIGNVSAEPEMAAPFVQDTVNFVGADIVVPDAGSYVADVADDLTSYRPLAGCKPPRVYVGTGPSLFFRAKTTVPITIAFGSPEPARGGDLNPRPQPIAAGWIGILAGHRLTPSGGVTPPAIASSAGALVRPNYTRSLRVEAA